MDKRIGLLGLVILIVSFTTDMGPMAKLVSHPLKLSGTYGELRSNHFHTGIDIKSSSGRVGDPIYSPKPGFVSRIAVKAGGYGNALYIDHPDGTTTVYAHLHAFPDSIAHYVKEQQYARESYEVNLFPGADRFPLKAGDLVGLLGNSGRSSGPHLHFEIRDTETEIPINPLLNGIDIADNIPPQIRQVRLDFMTPDKEVFHQKTIWPKRRSAGTYRISGDTIFAGAWRIGIQVKAYDQMNGAPNINGVYAMEMRVDDQESFGFKMDSIAFSELRYLNAHIDYKDRIRNKSYFNRLYRLPGNILDIYSENGEMGILKLYADKARKVSILVSDTEGNTSRIEFWVKRDAESMKTPEGEHYTHKIKHAEKQKISLNDADIVFESGTFYQNIKLEYSAHDDESPSLYSDVHSINFYDEPLQKYYTISLPLEDVPARYLDKITLGRCEEGGNWLNCGGKVAAQRFIGEVREAGNYALILDTIPPKITPVRFRKNMRGRSQMSFSIKDNLSVSGKAEALQYRGEIDGKWVLFKKSAYGSKITHDIEDDLEKGDHHLRIQVTDDRGNVGVYESAFSY